MTVFPSISRDAAVRHLAVLPVVVMLLFGVRIAAQDAIDAARQHYNEGQYEEAIARASDIWHESGSPTAAIVLARSQLERYRTLGDHEDLKAARRLLRAIDSDRLTVADRTEWELGLATGLHLSDQFGPAAEIFDRLLRRQETTGADRERLVDWWASAVDGAAHHLSREQRVRAYDRFVHRLESELASDPASAATTYWLTEAVRGSGDLERAWNLGVAGWIGAGPGSPTLRSDLDRLMLQGVIPDLATARTDQPADHPDTIAVMATLAADWESLKEMWGTAKPGRSPATSDSADLEPASPLSR